RVHGMGKYLEIFLSLEGFIDFGHVLIHFWTNALASGEKVLDHIDVSANIFFGNQQAILIPKRKGFYLMARIAKYRKFLGTILTNLVIVGHEGGSQENKEAQQEDGGAVTFHSHE